MTFGQRFPKASLFFNRCVWVGAVHCTLPARLHPRIPPNLHQKYHHHTLPYPYKNTNTNQSQEGQCFDYYFDTQSLAFQPWAQCVPKYVPLAIGGGPGETPFSQLTVPTVDTVGLGCV